MKYCLDYHGDQCNGATIPIWKVLIPKGCDFQHCFFYQMLTSVINGMNGWVSRRPTSMQALRIFKVESAVAFWPSLDIIDLLNSTYTSHKSSTMNRRVASVASWRRNFSNPLFEAVTAVASLDNIKRFTRGIVYSSSLLGSRSISDADGFVSIISMRLSPYLNKFQILFPKWVVETTLLRSILICRVCCV